MNNLIFKTSSGGPPNEIEESCNSMVKTILELPRRVPKRYISLISTMEKVYSGRKILEQRLSKLKKYT